MYLLCSAVVLLARRRFTRETEGVGFEPTVGFPTLDFESSALNRTQPPFPDGTKRRTPNVQHPTSNANAAVKMSRGQFFLRRLRMSYRRQRAARVSIRGESKFFLCLADMIVRLTGQKCYNFRLAMPSPRAAYCMSQGQPTLLLVVHYDSQVVCAAVHNYSHLIENLNPPLPP